jgi:hypothetical protein
MEQDGKKRTARRQEGLSREDSSLRPEVGHSANPVIEVVSKATRDLNDILNAVALRSALLGGQANSASAEAHISRLISLLDHATELVRSLQDYVRDLEASIPKYSNDRDDGGMPTILQESAGDLKRALSELPMESKRALVINERNEQGRLIASRLQRDGYHVTTTESLDDGLMLLKSGERFDSVFCSTDSLEDVGNAYASRTNSPVKRQDAIRGRH